MEVEVGPEFVGHEGNAEKLRKVTSACDFCGDFGSAQGSALLYTNYYLSPQSMTAWRLLHSIRYWLGLASFLFCAANGICQQLEMSIQRAVLTNAEKEFEFGRVVADSAIVKLISIVDDPLTDDSVKVEVIYFFGRYCCDKCITYLIEHIEDPFNYGDGQSDIDQANYMANWSILMGIADGKGDRRHLLPLSLDVLKRHEVSKNYILYLASILCLSSDKKTVKGIIEFELNEIRSNFRTLSSYTYENNLLLLLKQLE